MMASVPPLRARFNILARALAALPARIAKQTWTSVLHIRVSMAALVWTVSSITRVCVEEDLLASTAKLT